MNERKGGAEAFGREFGELMKRLDGQCGPLLDPGRGSAHAAIRLDLGRMFASELEDLIARHRVPEPIAEYVRHVVREGFHVAFDLMDPTDEAQMAERPAPSGSPHGA